ncbi:hypothetical protein M885DRAFT_516808 [Pelagophyceae sp. CCMP2097]|nr:hypothetical protein M885DRAFT_516808 [Pelagophyceae sp. CCMP2097]
MPVAQSADDYTWRGSLLDLHCCCCLPYQNAFGKALLAEADDGASVVRLLSPWTAPPGEVIGRAFSGTPTSDPELAFHWVLGDQLSDLNSPARQSMIQGIGTCEARVAACVSLLQCGSDPVAVLGSYGADGVLQAVLFARHLGQPPSECCSVCAVCGLCCCTGTLLWEVAAAFCCGPSEAGELGDVVDKTMYRFHNAYAPKEHVYVNMMAVSPEHQGKGNCGRLMRAVSRYADERGVPAYLECSGEKNPKVYAKFGYAISETAKLVHPSKPEASFDQFHAMVRPPAAK